jgi:alpha/beta superfamily hydrolase
MFSSGDRNSHEAITRAFVSQLGVTIVTANFRDGSTNATHDTGKTLQDLKSIVRYIMSMQSTFPSSPSLGVIGLSSGGYFALALCNALGPSIKVDFLIPICPVANPHARAMYLKHCIEETTPLPSGKDLYQGLRLDPKRAQEILDYQLQYFETYKQMSLAAAAVESNQHNIPTILIAGAQDKNVPPQVIQTTVSQWASRTIVIGNAGHELQTAIPSDPDQSYLPDLDRFLSTVLRDEGYLHNSNSSINRHRPWCS